MTISAFASYSLVRTKIKNKSVPVFNYSALVYNELRPNFDLLTTFIFRGAHIRGVLADTAIFINFPAT